ncbi:MAG: 2-amino-4-hydroxy-6-hydroxymethyldihydropteridine diphosphokinase [Alistipes sp.]|nr:2-amino-4-hydroxy-6-hydroxymethyldihydropteridine diphosphokinase [Alistipes sp.]
MIGWSDKRGEREVVLLFGSNDVAAERIVDEAIEIVAASVGRVERVSEEYRSEAYGFTSDREFVNRAAVLRTGLDAYEVLRRINLIEAMLGRDRGDELAVREATGERYASRPIDIDIIFYGTETFDDQRLTIPYHFLAERGYALRPVAEVVPDFRHPALEQTPQEMLRSLED